jgi:hypothetical protein
MEKSALAKVYGKSDCSCTVTFDFKTGETEFGVIVILDFTSVFMVTEKEFVTVCPLITTDIVSVWPALTPLSNAEVKHTNVEVEVVWATQVVY